MSTSGEKIQQMPNGKFALLESLSVGGLEAYKDSIGNVSFYWRYKHSGTKRVKIGRYDSSLPPKSINPKGGSYSVNAARVAATKLIEEHENALRLSGVDLTTKRKSDKQEKEAAVKAAEAVKIDAQAHTLGALLSLYVKHKEATVIDHRTPREIAGMVANHLPANLKQLPAKEVTTEQFVDAIRAVDQKGKGRTANKLRSYLLAAYELALTAPYVHTVPIAFKGFKVKVNPLAATKPNAAANRADKRQLKTDELRQYWQALAPLDDAMGLMLKLHLLLGSPRIAQVCRLVKANVDERMVTLFDSKGRRSESVEIRLPLIDEAKAALNQLLTINSEGEHVYSVNKGKSELSRSTLSNRAQLIATQAGIVDFELKRVRSGVETELARLGVSQEVRGRLQSHGLGGVQQRHYDGHDYIPQVTDALNKLYHSLTTIDNSGKVLPFVIKK
jgi:hypothetical protein